MNAGTFIDGPMCAGCVNGTEEPVSNSSSLDMTPGGQSHGIHSPGITAAKGHHKPLGVTRKTCLNGLKVMTFLTLYNKRNLGPEAPGLVS